jgi:hypothetical protein
MRLSDCRIGVIGTAEMPEYLVKNLRLAGLNAVLIPFKRFSLYKYLPSVDVVIFVFPINKLRLIRRAKVFGKITIAKWIGSDVMFGLNEKFDDLRKCLKYIDIHVSDAPLLKKELSDIGIRSFLIPIVPDNLKAKPKPLPEELAFLTYIITGKEDFYRADMIGRVAGRIVDAKFYVVENGRVPGAPSNVYHLGLLPKNEMEGVYEKVIAFLRLTKHDGISMSVLEALSYGRYVVRSIPFPPCIYADTEDEIVSAIEKLRGIREVNKEGIDFINNIVSPEHLASAWKNLFQELPEILSCSDIKLSEIEKRIDVM